MGHYVLEESCVYQDIVQIGWEKGRREGLAEGILRGKRRLVTSLLTYRFSKLSAVTRKQLGLLASPQVEELGVALLDFREKKDLTAWLREHSL